MASPISVARAASTPGSSTANSSPPSRAITPPAGRAVWMRGPIRHSSVSPAWWPSVSLISLKRSRSISSTAPVAMRFLPCSTRRSMIDVNCSRLGRSVRPSCSAWCSFSDDSRALRYTAITGRISTGRSHTLRSTATTTIGASASRTTSETSSPTTVSRRLVASGAEPLTVRIPAMTTLLARKYTAPAATMARLQRQLNSTPEAIASSPRIWQKTMPASAHGSVCCATLNSPLIQPRRLTQIADDRGDRLGDDRWTRSEHRQDGEDERRRRDDGLDAATAGDGDRVGFEDADQNGQQDQLAANHPVDAPDRAAPGRAG